MEQAVDRDQYDVVIVGAGACGASLARDLARAGFAVLLLERGSARKPRPGLAGLFSVAESFKVGPQLPSATAKGIGGATNLYFAVCKLPTAHTQALLGIDLSAELEQVQREIPIMEVGEDFVPPQAKRVRDAAASLGYTMKAHKMLLDASRCEGGRYADDAKWNARSYVDDAIAAGATVLSDAQVKRVLVENGRATGVEFRQGAAPFGRTRRVSARKVIVSAGSPATPGLLIGAGIDNVGSRGFFCKPSFLLFGTVKGLVGREAYLGQLECDLGDGVSLGDGSMSTALHRLFMLSNGKLGRLFQHPSTVCVAGALNDELGGRVLPDGSYEKILTADEQRKLDGVEVVARKILIAAGAENIFRARDGAGTPGGVLWVGEHLDHNLQTRVADLYVCDQSVMPDVRVAPLVTLLCLAKRLATHLTHTLRSAPAAADATQPTQSAAVREDALAV
jgi:hypothetical protein